VPLRQLGPVGPVDQRNVGEHRRLPAAGLVEHRLPEGVGQVVVAADDVGDAHVVIVDHHRQHVGWGTVGAEQDEIVELLVGDGHLALDGVVDGHAARRLGRLDADHRLHAGRGLGRVAIAPAAVVAHRPALRLGAGAHLLQLLGGAVAAVRLAGGQQLARHLGVTVDSLRLEHRIAVPVEPEPAQAVDDGVNGGLGGPCAVGVLDAQQEPPAVMAGEQPVEIGGARAANVQEAGRRRRKTGDDGHRAACWCFRSSGADVARASPATKPVVTLARSPGSAARQR
jgi:hypothetical protein